MPFLENCYEVSNTGRVRRSRAEKRTHVGRERALCTNRAGYKHFVASVGGRYLDVSVHKAVAWAFLGPPAESQTQVNHKNGVKTDNRVDNLEWCTRRENVDHARRAGLCHDEKPVLQFDKSGIFIAEYPSIHAAAAAVGGRAANISACCNGSSKRLSVPKTAHGFQWSLRGVNVVQRNLDGQLVATYSSQADACRATGISSSQMSACCRKYRYGKSVTCKSAYGFLWKFKEANQ